MPIINKTLYTTRNQCRQVFTCLLFLAIATISCTNSPQKKLNSIISKALRSGNDVNETEWQEINDYVLSKKDKLNEYMNSSGKPDVNKLQQLILQNAAARRGNHPIPDIYKQKDPNEAANRPHFNIYIENSLSMDGYVKGNTDFEGAITRLLVNISNYLSGQDKLKLHINFINSKIFQAKEVDINNFAAKLEPGSITYNVGGKSRGVSDLNQVFRTVLDSTANSISILISDCIYSLGKNSDTEGTLNIQKSLTMKAFQDKLRNTDLGTICLKLLSNFNGVYYNKEDKPVQVNTLRPYYIWLMGPKNLLEDFYATMSPENDLKGYKNNYILFPNTAEKTPFYTILKETGKTGRFKSDRGSRDFVHSIYDISYDNRVFQFTMAADLSKIPVDSSYAFDRNNYKLTDGFTLTDIKKINRNNILPRDWVAIENTGATHIFTIKTTKEYTLQNLQLSLTRQIPGWVGATHSIDDKNISYGGESLKTFGLKHLVEGVNDAYKVHNPTQQTYCTFIINIKN